MDLVLLENNAEKASSLLGAMANSRRLMILCKLLEGEKSVSMLSQSIGIGQSALSQHLAKLREKGLVSTRRDAQTIHYSIASDDVRAILTTLYAVFCAQ